MGPQDKDRFDDLLDRALKRYGAVEPRLGLEGRVLANLAAQPKQRPVRWKWVWATASVSALIVTLTIWLSNSSGEKASPHAPQQEENAILASPVPAPKAPQPVSGKAPHVRKTRRPVRVVAVEAEAKLQQFPSPRPISEQELMLLEYVHHYPEEAILIAKRQDMFQAAVEQAEREIRESSNQEGR